MSASLFVGMQGLFPRGGGSMHQVHHLNLEMSQVQTATLMGPCPGTSKITGLYLLRQCLFWMNASQCAISCGLCTMQPFYSWLPLAIGASAHIKRKCEELILMDHCISFYHFWGVCSDGAINLFFHHSVGGWL